MRLRQGSVLSFSVAAASERVTAVPSSSGSGSCAVWSALSRAAQQSCRQPEVDRTGKSFRFDEKLHIT